MEIKVSEVANLPTRYGTFKIQCFAQDCKEHLVLFTDPLPEIPVVRVHSECLTGDVLGSLKCDCGEQLERALSTIAEEGGLLIYLRQEGRNIGLLNKVNAYALQDRGLDTIEANHQLGFSADERTYEMVEFIMEFYNIKKIRLLTNNPKKMESLKGVQIIERIPITIEPNPHNRGYLKVKREKMGHLL
ncbi:MAG: GTP cyclohydrolase II [Epsilonproteobacteria bacterium]|nr:GTP cyclohydrolase II [Campylobacterota bacterium]NPA56648.1 GTP cyclohydrolase II [Campylobacterota bacterium]